MLKVQVDANSVRSFVELQEELAACVVESVMKWGFVLNGEVREQFFENVSEEKEYVSFM